MGKRGLKPVPTAILAARGSWRAKCRTMEPDFAGKPARPAGLGDAAAREWRRILPKLVNAGVVTTADSQTLGAYCVAVEEFHEANRVIGKTGLTMESPQGLKAHPAVAIRANASERMRKLAAEFGLTPSSRSQVKGLPREKRPEKNSAESFIIDPTARTA